MGRPDMACFSFTNHYFQGEPIRIFNNGDLEHDLYRDFTYIDDIVEGVLKIIPSPPQTEIPNVIYNMGCSSPVQLMDFIGIIEKTTGKKADLQMTEMQPGDVVSTYADTSLLEGHFGYKPSTSVEAGMQEFYKWFKDYEAGRFG